MTVDKEQFEELCSAYALGALDAEEQSLFDDALANGGEEYQKIFRESIAVAYFINSGIKRAAPSPLVKSKLLKRIHNGPAAPFSFSLWFERLALSLGFGRPQFGLVVAGLMAVVVLEVGAYAYLLYQDIVVADHQITFYEHQLAQKEQRLTALTGEVERQQEILNVLQSPKIEMVLMNGLEVNPAGYGKIIWDPERKTAILHVSKLPAAPSDKDYQLWFLDKNKQPVSAGVFSVTETDENYFKVSEIPVPDSKKDIAAFAVTIEPKGGVPQPTGAMYLLGAPGSGQ